MKLFNPTITLCSFLLYSSLNAQNFSAKVFDNESGAPIPYATIEMGEGQGIITNEEGEFSFEIDQIKRPQDSIYISYMGYETKGVFLEPQDSLTIALEPKIFELKEVFLTTEVLTVDEIIERVEDNLDKNYAADLTQKKIFFRQSDFNSLKKIDFGYKKSTIEEFNEKFIDSVTKLIPKKSSYYKEVVGDFYGDYKDQKLHITKAAELYDKNADISVEGVGEEMERMFNENVKKDSYLKIKSGIFSTKVQVDSILKENEEVKKEIEERKEQGSKYFQEQIKGSISGLYEQLFFQDDSYIDVIDKSSRYEFELVNYTVINEMSVYIINYKPKGSKDFKGTLYVNTQDFGVVRLDFQNVKPLKKFSLLGLTFRNTIYRGKMIFDKDKNGAYSPTYIELENGSYMAVDRPLKVIEKNKNVKGRRKQNELSLALDIRMNQNVKYEMVVFETESISQTTFNNAKENTRVKATYLSQYDPDFWKGHTIIEPNNAIENFKVVE